MVLNPFTIFKREWRILDRSQQQTSAVTSFAVDDALCDSIGRGIAQPTIHIWVHPKTVVLGSQDTRFVHLMDGINYLQDLGYSVIVRNSGGLAVVLDEGVCSISLVMPNSTMLQNIDHGFEMMVYLIKQLFPQEQITVGEVHGSYCPGRYDLSISGRKFSGISQRRRKDGTAVQAFMNLSGSGTNRAERIREFYQIAGGYQTQNHHFPLIQSHTIASIEELLRIPYTVENLLKRIVQLIYTHGIPVTIENQLLAEELPEYQRALVSMLERNIILTTPDVHPCVKPQ